MDRITGVKIKAATLIETVIALVIIMIVFGIAFMIYLNILKSSYSNKQLEGFLLLKEVAKETKEDKSFYDEEIVMEEIKVSRTITRYKDMQGVLLLKLEAFDLNNKSLSIRNELLYVEPDE